LFTYTALTCETLSLTLREERRLRVFENRVLRRLFGPKRDEVTGEWRKIHNEELNDLYSSPIIFRVIKSNRMRWVGHVARIGERRCVYRVLVGKREGKRPLGKHINSWEGNINPLKPNDLKKASYRTANLQMLHLIYLFNKYTY